MTPVEINPEDADAMLSRQSVQITLLRIAHEKAVERVIQREPRPLPRQRHP